ncbi:MAG: hypothetical protein WA139_04975 [Candidatus Aenigmatarchaeota archaeon]
MIEYAVYPFAVSMYFPAKYVSSVAGSYLLKKRNMIKSTDVVWNVGCGMSGVETFGIGAFAKECYGIDPDLWFQKKKGKYKLVKAEVRKIIDNPDIPRPDFVFSKDYSGIQRDIEALFQIEPPPSFFISPCNCSGCKNRYYKKDYPLSKKMLDEKGIKTYAKINPKKPTKESILDMAWLSEEYKYRWKMSDTSLFITKDESRF